MARCEDYPCCGHEPGDCPDSDGRYTCVGCGKRLPRSAPSSYCTTCQRRKVWRQSEEGQEEHHG